MTYWYTLSEQQVQKLSPGQYPFKNDIFVPKEGILVPQGRTFLSSDSLCTFFLWECIMSGSALEKCFCFHADV